MQSARLCGPCTITNVHIIFEGVAADCLNQVFLAAGMAAIRANIEQASIIDLPAALRPPFKLRGLRLRELRVMLLLEVPWARRRAGPAGARTR